MDERIDRVALAEKLLSLSQTMLLAYQNERFDDLPEIQRSRESLIGTIFADARPGELGDLRWIDIIKKVQVLNDQLVEVVSQKRDRLGQELSAFRNARKADSAYASAMFEDNP